MARAQVAESAIGGTFQLGDDPQKSRIQPAFQAFTQSPPGLSTTGTRPALKPATGTFSPLPPKEETELKADPRIDAAALQREVRARSLGTASTESKSKPAQTVKAAAALPGQPTDTFVKQKMKEAETNLPDFDFDFPDDE